MGIVGLAAFSFLVLTGQDKGLPNGAVCGSVKDPTGNALGEAEVRLRAEGGDSGERRTTTDGDGEFCFTKTGANTYELSIKAKGFRAERRRLAVRDGETAREVFRMALETVTEQITVAEGGADPTSLNVAETRIGEGLLKNLPSESINAALSSILTLTTPGVAADSNGVFHPLGEHAETSFSIDGQPISDQQSRIFSNQISASTIEEMRTLQGAPPAEYGDKTSLIVEARSRSGLDAGQATGSVTLGYGSFATPTASVTLSSGNKTLGNFLAVDGVNSERFLDTPEFVPLHANGNAESVFDRIDWKCNEATSVRLNLSAARSWFQVPNTYDQESTGQDQRQHMTSFNVGLGFSHVSNSSWLTTANTWIRQDRVNYFPSANVFSDQPATLQQSRRLTSTGMRGDVSYSRGRHSAKGGVQVQVTPLAEEFRTGLTDAAFNSPCADAVGTPVGNASFTATNQCSAVGYAVNPSFQPALVPYDLTRGGTPFAFRGGATIFEDSAYVQDSMKLGVAQVNVGIRYDNYAGLSKGHAFEPRTGLVYTWHATGMVFHVSYARVFLTPYNENLVLSSATGAGGLGNGSLGATDVQPLTPARRNQFNTGVEWQVGTKFNLQAEYFWKYTDGAYDFNTILNTPLNFPVQFRKSKIDGALVRATLTNWHGLSVFTVMGHSRSRLFSPEIGGIDFGTSYAPVARPDHDQEFEQTTNAQYEFSRRAMRGLWLGLTWRYDSGLVVVSVPDYATALALTGDQQQEMRLYCGSAFATVTIPLRSCGSASYGATLVHIVQPGTYNADTNPSRIRARNLFDIAIGSDRIWKRDRFAMGGKLAVVNLMDKVALYNFLSSFSGTHFLSPRTLEASMTLRF
jgi:hypothetical protein